MDKHELKNRLEKIEQDLKRERFGLERYLAQCKRWQKEIEDLDGGGFFSFLTNTESKKREARQTLSDCKRDLEGAVAKVNSLEAEEKIVRDELATFSSSDDSTIADGSTTAHSSIAADGSSTVDSSTAVEGSDVIGVLDDEIQNEAIALLEKIEKIIDVSNQSISEAYSQLASARVRSDASVRPGKGRTRSVPLPSTDSSGSNIQMALDCLDEPVQKLCQLLNPVAASLIESSGSMSEDSLVIFREKLLSLSNLARGLKTPEDYSVSGGSPIDLADDTKTTEITTSLAEMATSVSLIQGFLKK